MKKQAEKLFEEGTDIPFQTADDGEPIADEITAAVRNAFGIRYLFPWQRIVIANILDAALSGTAAGSADEDCGDGVFYDGKQIVLLPTGAGKSLCFLAPALLLGGPTLVIYPLLALMSDQKRRMDEGNLGCVVFRGGQTREEREECFSRIADGSARIILANPEVLLAGGLAERLSACGIRHIAIDEAHCASEWGDSFRPAYLSLGEIIRRLGCNVVTAFTATASPQVLRRMSEVIFGRDVHIVRSDSDRPNIHYRVVNAFDKKREAVRLALTEEKPALIFCGTRKKAEDMARELVPLMGAENVRFYHAGMTKAEKDAVEAWYFPKTDAVLCATCAFGMGVDKKDIRTVIHLEASPTVESYIQEAGRGARDGKDAEAILLWSNDDHRRAKELPDGDRAKSVAAFAESTTCRRQVLLDALGAEQAVCDGCDVCGRNGPAPFAEDAETVLSFIKRNRKLFTKESVSSPLLSILNGRDAKKFGMNIWEQEDIDEILRELEEGGFIHECTVPWRGALDVGAPRFSRVHGTADEMQRKADLAGERLRTLPRRLRRRLLLPREQGQRERSAGS